MCVCVCVCVCVYTYIYIYLFMFYNGQHPYFPTINWIYCLNVPILLLTYAVTYLTYVFTHLCSYLPMLIVTYRC